ncbi:MAG: relaxase [Chitinophagaceae bacterium]|nr:MAG: relaxase [Chitinophagaceae bacterium]
MIGKIVIGKSFRGCINYCLENKPEQQILGLENRAEILCFNLCGGDKLELINQFNEVRNLRPGLAKPVMHITLSLAPGEKLDKENLVALVEDCAREMGFDKNMYLGVFHNDTGHQHVHIIANRIGFDGKTLKDNHNFRKIAAFCRKAEIKFGMQQVLSPRKFLAENQRDLPRHDLRKERLHQDIQDALKGAKNYQEFEQVMKAKGYQIAKARGIAFIDRQKVRVKGSEVGYSLSRIERQLLQNARAAIRIYHRKPELSPNMSLKIDLAPLKELIKGLAKMMAPDDMKTPAMQMSYEEKQAYGIAKKKRKKKQLHR